MKLYYINIILYFISDNYIYTFIHLEGVFIQSNLQLIRQKLFF